MTQTIAVTKAGENVLTASDPNDFIFHSEYNTFKIIAEGTLSDSINSTTYLSSYTVAHGLSYTPLVNGFCELDGYSNIMLPEEKMSNPLVSDVTVFRFNYIESDATNITFNVSNYYWSSIDFIIKYYIFEVPL